MTLADQLRNLANKFGEALSQQNISTEILALMLAATVLLREAADQVEDPK